MSPRTILLLLATISPLFSRASPPWNCKIDIGSAHWDLNPLNGEKTATRIRTTPPSEFHDEVRFNVCDELKPREGYDSLDQCVSGTLACLTEINKKPNDGTDRITGVVPLATTSNLNVQYQPAYSAVSKGVVVTLHGPSYPPDAAVSVPQSFNLTLLCSTSDSDPKFVNYDHATGVLDVEWSVKAACPSMDDDHKGGDHSDPPNGGTNPPGDEKRGSGIGWFFLLPLLGVLAYFGLGAYYNYNNYGSTGWDLVPHRDFWREVPYLIEDLVSYLFSSVRSGGSRSGYRRVARLPPVSAAAFNQKDMERRAQNAVTTSAHGMTCDACRKTFSTENSYRSHVQSRKHREREFAASLHKSQPAAAEEKQETIPETEPTSETTESPETLAPVEPTTLETTNEADDPVPEAATEEMDLESRLTAARSRLSPTSCLFCAHTSPSTPENITHMKHKHGFFIPDSEYLTNLPGLLSFLGARIAVDNTCLWCKTKRWSAEAVRQHMVEKSHCKLPYDSLSDRLDISDYYDFSASYDVDPSRPRLPRSGSASKRPAKKVEVDEDGWEDDDAIGSDADEVVELSESSESEVDPAENELSYGSTSFELVLPTGARIGHRSLRRYYTQSFANPMPTYNPTANSGTALVKRLLQERGSAALIPASGGGFGKDGRGTMTIKTHSVGAAKHAGRHIREHWDTRKAEQYRTKISTNMNSNKKRHFRDQLLQ
ncbi:hypothetical protein FRB99_005694 [Tulasnella sp. 403]|nr:hypothetical protein FRB99_005694 [Tulasnella sp. 403]